MIRATTEQLDQLLDELEELARSSVPSGKFLAVVLEQLRSTISAPFAAVMLPADGAQWWPLASSGRASIPGRAEQAIAHQLAQAGAGNPASLTGTLADTAWLAVPLRPRGFDKGYLLVTRTSPIPQAAVDGLVELLAAFAEVIQVRQQRELEGFVDQTWDQVQGLCLQISQAPNYEQAATWLVAGLARSLAAARVTLLSSAGQSTPRVQAVSGAPKFSATADVIRGLQTLAAELQRSGKPLLRQQSSQSPAAGTRLPSAPPPADEPLPGSGSPSAVAADGCFANLLGLRLAAHSSPTEPPTSNTARSPAHWLVIEYSNQAEMIRSLGVLPQVLPAVAVAWEQQLRWLSLPKLARRLVAGSAPSGHFGVRRWAWPVSIAVLCLAVWILRLPYPLTIEAEGAYEPAIARAIYAADDGFVEQLLVEDGKVVSAGDPLVQLRAPALELRIEQVSGELREVIEETNGIRIAINQLAADATEALHNQSRLASKIIELETKHEHLQRQLDMLQSQRERLLLRAPIAGTVVAKDLQRHLAARPVRRGDALFSIVDLAGPWQVRVQVADRDAAYVRGHYAPYQASESRLAAGHAMPTANTEVNFILTSTPAKRWAAKVRWIADHVENRHGQGCTVEVRAELDSAERPGAHAGAGVHAFFVCGSQPLWFVWSRPLVEAVQRKLWFRNPTHE